MEATSYAFIVPAVAVILDYLIGDPHTFPHPVRFIGNGLDLFEAYARKIGMNLRLAGWIALVLFAGSVWAIAEAFVLIPYLGFLIAIYLGYAGLALGCLLKECRHVESLLYAGNIVEARKAVAMLVSRDTAELDESEIRRTLAETLSENLNDGFVAPLFYLTIFGPAGLWAYKTVSTMDSMWGYKTERFRDLGFAAAKTDDVLAYIPARLTALVLLLVGQSRELSFKKAWSESARDARKMESPNAGWPMAACSWILGAQMGGKTVYFGKVKEKPILGPKGEKWDSQKISALLLLCRNTGFVAAFVFIAFFSIF